MWWIDIFFISIFLQSQSDAIISTSKQNIEKWDQETEPEQPKGEIGKMSSWISNWWSKNEKSEVASQMKSADTHTSFIANNVQKFISSL